MRPSPDEVRAWFAGALTDEDLAAYLGVLRRPELARRGAPHHRHPDAPAALLPGGEWLNVTLRCVDALGRPLP